MGKKSKGKKKKKPPASQSGVAGKGAQRPEHAADYGHGPAVYRSASPVIPVDRNVSGSKPVLTGESGGFTEMDRSRLVQANLETPAPGEHVMGKGTLDRDRLHPSLRDLPDDAEISVIMAPGDEEPPAHAGEYLGTLEQPYRTPEGDTVPAGYRIYRKQGLVTVSEKSDVTTHYKVDDLLDLDEERRRERNHGLAAELAGRDVPGAARSPLSVKLNAMRPPGRDVLPFTNTALNREGQRLEVSSSGSPLPDWFEVREPAPPQIHHMRAGDVLDVHSRLAETMARPPAALLEFFDAFVTDTMEKAGARGGDWEKVNRWAGMFWPAQTAVEWCGILAHQLKTARTYQVTAPMVDKVTELYHEGDRSITHIEHDDLPWPAGFAYLDKPSTLTDPRGNVIYNRAYSWDTVYIPYREDRLPGVRVISWSHPGDQDAYWTEDAREMMNRYGGLGLGNTVVFPFRERLYTQTDPDLPPQDSAPRWLRCLWQTLESVIGTTRKAPPDEIGRHARRRAARSLVHGEVSVVLLRRSMTIPEPGTGIPQSFPPRHDFRWPVDEFWRHVRRDEAWEEANPETGDDGRPRRHHAVPDTSRTRCAICGAKVSHVASFIKGPPGLPIRQRKQLYRLAR